MNFSASNIIDGKHHASIILKEVSSGLASIKENYSLVPLLAIVLVGSDPASVVYVRNKLEAAEKVGIKTQKVSLPEGVTEEELLSVIDRLNKDKEVSGIIVQLPLPPSINKDKVLCKIDPDKDVDGFHPINVGKLHSGGALGFVPGTALGCVSLIKAYEPNLAGKHAVVIGRSNIVGRPVAALLLQENCTVTMAHSKTRDLPSITSFADIVVSAVGKPHFLTEEYFNERSMVIDVGINRSGEGNKLVGDVDFQGVKDKVKYITPVPGGVGPTTVAFLLKNTLQAALNQYKLNGFKI